MMALTVGLLNILIKMKILKICFKIYLLIIGILRVNCLISK
jgi:hypothetical protein